MNYDPAWYTTGRVLVLFSSGVLAALLTALAHWLGFTGVRDVALVVSMLSYAALLFYLAAASAGAMWNRERALRSRS